MYHTFAAKKWRQFRNMLPGGGTGSMAPPLLAVVDNELYAAWADGESHSGDVGIR